MQYLKYIGLGIVFGIMFTKAEIISWFRIYEMFRFESFHMYGIIGSAVILSIISTTIIKKMGIKDIGGNPIVFSPKDKGWRRYLMGGSIFGMGWALTGACPGPLYVLIGNGALMVIVIILSAVAGTWLYGYFSDKLPH
ncbi:YeeE/YedE family protein [bacterium SCSIO 12643]|nr:YeeE/YedE family protein [bacterium SCSIO 12643]